MGLHRFRFDRVESTFFNFSDDTLLKIPGIIEASTKWIRGAVSSLKFASHQFVYSSHCQVANFLGKDVLRPICANPVKSAGFDLGAGVVLHWEVPDRSWTTQLVLDRSLTVKDGLYIMFTLLVRGEVLDYATLARDARSYIENVLGELGLTFNRASM